MSFAEWTVMIFLNGDNNLEPFAIKDFREIAKIGSSEKVNVVAQFDRNGGFAATSPQWKGCYRFKIEKGMPPSPADAIEDLGNTNMGSGSVLRSFVEWAMGRYPAKRYMLEIWNHGQGWRFFRTVLPNVSGLELSEFHDFKVSRIMAEAKRRESFFSSSKTSQLIKDMPAINLQSIPVNLVVPGTVRSVSSDDTSRDTLYNREMQDSLSGISVDLIGFDACLMGMIETGYAFRERAKVMVASEELEPGDGWNYSDWIGRLVTNPEMDAADLGKTLVDSYKKTYTSVDETVTLSAIDLSHMKKLADKVDNFSSLLSSSPLEKFQMIHDARKECEEYAPGYGLHGIDLATFSGKVADRFAGSDIAAAAKALSASVQEAVIANHAGTDRLGNFGSQGLAIYFPASKALFNSDIDHVGYMKTNNDYPVEFVQNHKWSEFLLNKYLPHT